MGNMTYATDPVAEEIAFWDWNGIKEEVEKNDGVLTVTMEKLRTVHGSKKSGVNVRAEISETLAGMNIAHIPQELPSNQKELVRLYKKDTPMGNLIDTVLQPSERNDGELREQIKIKSARRRMRQVPIKGKALPLQG